LAEAIQDDARRDDGYSSGKRISLVAANSYASQSA
jgi:hypothetical protein